MIIEVSKVSPEGTRYEGEEPADILELDVKYLKVGGPITCDFHVELASHELIVRGTIRLPLSARCGRCAEFFSTTAEDSSFLRAYAVPEGTETVDLTGDIREDILLNLPVFPVCSPGCKGLCPQCGKNWNKGRCTCKPVSGKPGAWTALDGLKLE
jgi:uncharacterized protein